MSPMIIRIRGVKKVRSKGHVYLYHRKTGTRLPAGLTPEELLRKVAELDGQAATPTEPKNGSLGAMMAAYRGSGEFAGLARSTREDYLHVMDWLATIDDMAVTMIDTPFIMKLRDKAFRQRKRRFANYVTQVLSLLYTWGIPRGWAKGNPAMGIVKIKRPKGAPKQNRAWSPEERQTVLQAATGGVRVAVALGAFCGVSEGDALHLPRSGAYDGQRLRYVRRKTGVPADIMVPAEVRAILDEELARGYGKDGNVKPMTLVATHRGTQFTESGFRASFFKVIRHLKEKGAVADGLTFHGLRHSVAKDIIDAGGSTKQAMAVLAQRTPGMADHYSDEYNRRDASDAAIASLERKRKQNGKPRRTKRKT